MLSLDWQESLELRVIDFDHLTEEEQRDRKLLLPNEIYVPKSTGKKSISQMGSEHTMRLESKKCQILCIRCHVLTTMFREKGLRKRSGLEKVKLDYVNKLKCGGCKICGYINSELPRFFDMDHLDPNTKTECVGRMVMSHEFSLQQVKSECELCRVLCRECHRIHTSTQLKNGVISDKQISNQKKKLSLTKVL